MNKTLLWHQGALGDLILSLPAIYAIKAGSRPAYLHLISRTDIADIVIENRLADAVASNENGLFADFFMRDRVSRRAACFLKEFTTAYIFAKRADGSLIKNLTEYIPQSFVIATRPGEGRVAHVSASQVEQLKLLAVSSGEEMPTLEARSISPTFCRGKPVVAIHPGSGGRKKRWPVNRFFELIKSLDSEKRYYFCLMLGPAEDDELVEVSNRFISANRIDASVVSGLPVADIASLLKSSSLYIGNDSGITHMASALGIPTLAVFGPTDPKIWGPFGAKTRVFYSGYPCSPCSEADRSQCAHVGCLKTIEVNDLLAAARDVFSERSL